VSSQSVHEKDHFSTRYAEHAVHTERGEFLCHDFRDERRLEDPSRRSLIFDYFQEASSR
jgi:hypothetical protein